MKLSKLQFQLLLNLTQKQPWLSDKSDELENLLFNDCSDQNQIDLILDLLSRFEYVSSKTFGKMLSVLVEDIITDPNLTDESTQIVAMAADSGADSSQYMIYTLKPIFQKMGWTKHKFVNKFGKAYKTFRTTRTHKNIVLVDEFIGSGQTAKSRVKEIQKTFTNNGVTKFSVKVEVLVATSMGMDNLEKSGIQAKSQITLPKGISDFYSSGDVPLKIALMKRLESLLKDKVCGRNLPSLGYGETETLYCRETGNSPNSVFPIFWWPRYSDSSYRPTILIRAMGDA